MLNKTLISILLASVVSAAPKGDAYSVQSEERQLLKNLFPGLQQAAKDIANPYPGVLSALSAIKPKASPTTIEDAVSVLKSAHAAASPRGYFEQSATS